MTQESPKPLEVLVRTGEALHGPRWREQMARQLHRPGADRPGVDLRLLHRWLSGERPAPEWIPDACAELLRAQAGELLALADTIPEAA